MEEGIHKLNEDFSIIAGHFDADSEAMSSVNYGESFEQAPIVMSQVASNNDASAVNTRQDLVSATGFSLRLQGPKSDRSHSTETINWMAFTSVAKADYDSTHFEAG